MTGVSRTTGLDITDRQHLSQSVADILTTPIGSRVMRREYGSLVPDLIDQPLNGTTTVRLYSAVVSALMKWEPRLRISRVQLYINTSTQGAATLDISATVVDTNESTNLSIPLKLGAA